jgi:nucleoside-diphosphate-sugar epimerase
MRIFLTGATGFIGTALIPELIQAGHQVLGLTRSEEGVAQLAAAGVEPYRGNIEDLDSLRGGAAQSDAVIHLAFNHDFSKFATNCENDRLAITAMAEVLEGAGKTLIITSGTGMVHTANGAPSTETDAPATSQQIPRAASEEAALAAGQRGVRSIIVRLPQVHDTHRQGLVSYALMIAREKGVVAYVGEGANRWPAAHISDTARLYRLALEKGQPGDIFHAVDEEGISAKAIAETLGKGLNLPVKSITPEEAGAHFGWLAAFVGRDLPSSSAITRKKLGWTPTGPDMLTDLRNMAC